MDEVVTTIKPGESLVVHEEPLEILADQKNPIMALREPERIALKESIQIVGVQIPIVVSLGPTRGRIIDGFHRWEICKELAMNCPLSFKLYNSVKEEDEAALGLNVQRRQLDDLAAGLINIQLLDLNGIVGRGRKSLSGATVADVARLAGQTERTFYRRVEMARLLMRPDCGDIRKAYRDEEISSSDAMTLARQRKKEADEGGESKSRPRKGENLRDMVTLLKKGGAISPLEQARMEAFTEGVKWGAEAVSEKPVDPEWILEQLQDWRQSVFDREQAEREAKRAEASA